MIITTANIIPARTPLMERVIWLKDLPDVDDDPIDVDGNTTSTAPTSPTPPPDPPSPPPARTAATNRRPQTDLPPAKRPCPPASSPPPPSDNEGEHRVRRLRGGAPHHRTGAMQCPFRVHGTRCTKMFPSDDGISPAAGPTMNAFAAHVHSAKSHCSDNLPSCVLRWLPLVCPNLGCNR